MLRANIALVLRAATIFFQLSNFHAVFETAGQEQLLVHLGAAVLTALFSEQLSQCSPRNLEGTVPNIHDQEPPG
jgi:hypothetical protein